MHELKKNLQNRKQHHFEKLDVWPFYVGCRNEIVQADSCRLLFVFPCHALLLVRDQMTSGKYAGCQQHFSSFLNDSTDVQDVVAQGGHRLQMLGRRGTLQLQCRTQEFPACLKFSASIEVGGQYIQLAPSVKILDYHLRMSLGGNFVCFVGFVYLLNQLYIVMDEND